MIDLNTTRFHKTCTGNGVNLLHGLYDLAVENIKPQYILCEIGSYRGVSSSLLAEFCQTLYCVDSWTAYSNDIDSVSDSSIQEAEQEFDKRSSLHKNIIKVKTTSLEACKVFGDEYFDLVYIDGSHTYNDVKNDILNWITKIKPNGYISGHDFVIPSVAKAIDDTIGNKNIKTYRDSSWIKRI